MWALRADTSLGSTPWPKYQGDLANHGRADHLTVSPAAALNLVANIISPGGTIIHLSWESALRSESYEVWRAAGEDFAQAQPLATNVSLTLRFEDDLTRAGVIYSYWVRGKNVAGDGPFAGPVTASQTNQSWAVAFQARVNAPVVADDGTVFVTATGGSTSELNAFSPEGLPLWVFADHPVIHGPPVIGLGGNLIFSIGFPDCSIRAVTPTGQHRWPTRLTQGILGAPAVDSYGTTYFAQTTGNYLYAVSTDGVLLWNALCSSPPDHAVIGADGAILLADRANLYCWEPSGTLRWQLKAPGSSPFRWSTPSLNPAAELITIFGGARGSSLIRVTPDGKTQSTNQIAISRMNFYQEPVMASDGSIYFIGNQMLVSLEASGAIRWTNKLQYASVYLPNVVAVDRAGNVYAVLYNELQVFDSGGSLVSRLEQGHSPTSPPVLTADGRLASVATGFIVGRGFWSAGSGYRWDSLCANH